MAKAEKIVVRALGDIFADSGRDVAIEIVARLRVDTNNARRVVAFNKKRASGQNRYFLVVDGSRRGLACLCLLYLGVSIWDHYDIAILVISQSYFQHT